MNRTLCLLLVGCCLLIVSKNSHGDQALSFHIDTSEGGDISTRRIESLKSYLQQNKCNVQHITTAKDAVENNKSHIIFSPLRTASDSNMKNLAELQLINDQPLAGSILVRSSTGIKNLQNLDGVHIAFLSKHSITGHQLQQQLFQQAGILHKEDKITLTQTHSAAAALLLHGDVFAAAIATPLAKKWAESNNLIIVSTSEAVTKGGLWAAQNLDDDSFNHCRKAFINLTAD